VGEFPELDIRHALIAETATAVRVGNVVAKEGPLPGPEPVAGDLPIPRVEVVHSLLVLLLVSHGSVHPADANLEILSDS